MQTTLLSGPLEAGAVWGSPRRRHLAGLTSEDRSHVLLLALLSTFFLFHDSFCSPGIWNGFQFCGVLTARCLRSLQLLPGLTYGFVSGAAKMDFEDCQPRDEAALVLQEKGRSSK